MEEAGKAEFNSSLGWWGPEYVCCWNCVSVWGLGWGQHMAGCHHHKGCYIHFQEAGPQSMEVTPELCTVVFGRTKE